MPPISNNPLSKMVEISKPPIGELKRVYGRCKDLQFLFTFVNKRNELQYARFDAKVYSLCSME